MGHAAGEQDRIPLDHTWMAPGQILRAHKIVEEKALQDQDSVPNLSMNG